MKINLHKLKFNKGTCLYYFFGVLFLSCNNDSEYHPIRGEVYIAPHFQNADATIIQLTDHYFPNTYSNFQNDSRKNAAAYAEYLAFQFNVPLHVFDETDKWEEFEEFLRTGRGGASIYYPSCFKKYEESRLYNILKDIESIYGRSPTTISYGCGKSQYSDSLPNYILGGRNSVAPFSKFNQSANTWYGNDFGDSLGVDYSNTDNLINRPSGGRFYSEIQRYGKSREEASLYVIQQVEKTINSKGFYTNFMHWHDYYPNKNGDTIAGVKVMPYLFEALQEGIGNANTAKVDYNEAVEYIYAKEAIDSVYFSKNNENKYKLNFILKKNRPIDYSVIKTPITLIIPKETLTKFKIEAFNYETEYGLGATMDTHNNYLNIPLDFSKDSISVLLDVVKPLNNMPIAFQKPELVIKDLNTVICNTESKFVLFRRKKNDPEYEIEIVDRQFKYSKEYRIPNLDNRYHYFCGAINKQRESTLIAL